MRIRGIGINKTMSARTIGVAGCQERIGTTTQALQVVAYLSLMGFASAYVEMNNSYYIENMCDLYTDVKQDFKSGKVIYQGIDLFTKKQVGTEGFGRYEYSFLVKDYGSCQAPDFENLSFLEQETKLYVCGTKPNEIVNTQKVVESSFYSDAKYIFVFTPKLDREDIRKMMEEKAEHTGFADYVPDPFLYISNANQLYKSLLGL